MQYEKPELINFDNHNTSIVQGSSVPPCSGPPCTPLPGPSPAPPPGGRMAKPLVLDSNGNPVIVSDK